MKNKAVSRVYLLELLITILILVAVCLLFFFLRAPINSREVLSIESSFPRFTVVIDAGHGGIDSGASEGKILEKDLNLVISKKIAEVLSFYDVDIYLTRDSDCLLADELSKHKKRDDLYARVNAVKKFPNPIFVSIHMNKFPEIKYKGLQVFYSLNSPYSEALALVIRDNNKKYLEPDNAREIKKSNSSIYVLDRLNCPSVLIECGFLSNPDDLMKLCNEQYQYELAFVIANSIIEYIKL